MASTTTTNENHRRILTVKATESGVKNEATAVAAPPAVSKKRDRSDSEHSHDDQHVSTHAKDGNLPNAASRRKRKNGNLPNAASRRKRKRDRDDDSKESLLDESESRERKIQRRKETMSAMDSLSRISTMATRPTPSSKKVSPPMDSLERFSTMATGPNRNRNRKRRSKNKSPPPSCLSNLNAV
ncbi:MAG: hypothetical protein SGARI_005330 [Bacillariaceae sp.]